MIITNSSQFLDKIAAIIRDPFYISLMLLFIGVIIAAIIFTRKLNNAHRIVEEEYALPDQDKQENN